MRNTLSGLVLGHRSVYGAGFGATAAIDTRVGFYDVLAVLLCDHRYRALVHAFAATYAIVCDDVRHCNVLLDSGRQPGELTPSGNGKI